MHVVEPKVFVIASTTMATGNLADMLEAVGAPNWNTQASSGGEKLVEVAGRLCYKSFEPGLNPNVTKVREGNADYILNILKQGHGSVLEHASATVAFIGVSRILTHELVRHRAGCAYSQESMRYVRLEDVGMYIPDAIKNHPELSARFQQAAGKAEEAYADLVKLSGIEEMKDFHQKKVLTSAFRRIAPSGHTTNIITTANHRAWRHLIDLRTAEGAEEEIVKAFMEVARQFVHLFPSFYQDMTTSAHSDNPNLFHCRFKYDKV